MALLFALGNGTYITGGVLAVELHAVAVDLTYNVHAGGINVAKSSGPQVSSAPSVHDEAVP